MVDLCFLDSALCNHDLRSYFLNEIIGLDCTMCRGLENTSVGKSYLVWLQSRNYAVSYLQLESYLDRSEMDIDYKLKYLHRLNTLKVRFATRSTVVVLREILSCCSSLTDIHLTGSTLVKDSAAVTVIDLCPMLRRVDFNNSGITDETLVAIASHPCGKNMLSIDVSYCSVTDTGLVALAGGCDSLQKLHVNCLRSPTRPSSRSAPAAPT